jgi:hypothetical protein
MSAVAGEDASNALIHFAHNRIRTCTKEGLRVDEGENDILGRQRADITALAD